MTTSALIIGGGIGGLCAGIALQQIGITVSVYERTPAIKPVGAGISLWANALDALRHLGVYDALQQHGNVGSIADLRDPNGRSLTNTSAQDILQQFGERELLRTFHRADLQAALLNHLGPEHLHLDHACTRFTTEANTVTAHFSNGHTATADILIGADGLHSIIRKQLHGEKRPLYAGYTAWRAVIDFDSSQLLPGETWGRGSRFGQLPLTQNHSYWFATCNQPQGATAPNGEKAFLQSHFADWHDPIPALINATPATSILRNDIYDRDPLDVWGNGRVTLLGDSVHPMTPNMGQGACQAIEDAVVLGHTLANSLNDPANALRAYEQKRQPRTRAITLQSRRIGQVGQWQNPLAIALRNTLTKAIPSRIQHQQLKQLLTPNLTA